MDTEQIKKTINILLSQLEQEQWNIKKFQATLNEEYLILKEAENKFVIEIKQIIKDLLDNCKLQRKDSPNFNLEIKADECLINLADYQIKKIIK